MRERNAYTGTKVVVMGLGLNGGGTASARYLAERGAEVTVTDLRDEKTLAPALESLKGAGSIRYVLGGHRIEDFDHADLVVKNPGVRPDSPYLQQACRDGRIITDISLFLDFLSANCPHVRLIAVTGSKGKSSTASAIHWTLDQARQQGLRAGASHLGGNITVSPLSFADTIAPNDAITLELSSWQLGDLTLTGRRIKPSIAVITPIMPDHLDRYTTMDAYVADKRLIYQQQDGSDCTIASCDAWGQSFLRESRARQLCYRDTPFDSATLGGWLDPHLRKGFAKLEADGDIIEIVPEKPLVLGLHQKKNLLIAGLALLDVGLPASFIAETLGRFPGVAHRLEFFLERRGVRFYNDTTATVPDAVLAAVKAFENDADTRTPVVLVAGGADKGLDFAPLVQAAVQAKTVILLAGTAAEKLKTLLRDAGVSAPIFDTVEDAVRQSLELAEAGDAVVLSPGCASFGMFQNEFERGRQWKEAVLRLA